MKFNVGDRVMWAGDDECFGDEGTVSNVYVDDFEVEWDDGYSARYISSESGTCFRIEKVSEVKETPWYPDDSEEWVEVESDSSVWSNKHYDFFYSLSDEEIKNRKIKIDPYFVSKQWRLGQKDESGILFHNLKTLARFGDKNSREREIKALHAQIVRLAELEGVELNIKGEK